MKTEVPRLEKYAQVVSRELMAALKESAEASGISLDMEIAIRLMVAMTEPKLNKGVCPFNQIMHQNFTHSEAIAECKRKREAALCLYEMEKLRLFLSFEKNLPRGIKESFTVINVKEATEALKAKLVLEDKVKKTEGK